MTDAYPLVSLPGGNVFIADSDLTTEPRPDGSRAISCKPISGKRAAYDAARAARYLARLASELG